MAQETEAVAGVKGQPRDHIEEDEVSELHRTRSFYDGVREQAERFASTRLGQFIIERGDRALRMIEDTAKWSLPQEKSADPLQRPLPWGPFLFLIIMLRLTRMWLSLGALMIGNSPISPSDLVYFIQTRRRKLRAIRVHGLKVMRQRQQEVSYGSGKGLTHKLTQWFSRAMCRPGVQKANSGRLFQVRNMEQTTQTSPAVMKRPREDETNTDLETDHNLTIDQMLAKYALENSEDDSDFVPNPDEEEESSDGTSSESNTSEEISSDEANDIADQATRKPPALVVENGVHKAEPNERKDKEMEMAKENDKGKLSATTTSNGGHDKEQAEVAGGARLEEDKWKSSPGHMSAAMTKIQSYNSTAAAAGTEAAAPCEPEPEPETESESDPTPDPQSQSHDESDDDGSSTSSSKTGCTVYRRETTFEKTQPDTQTEQTSEVAATLTTQVSNYPTIDTLTPATSSEDIFYSPIGSPTLFNTSLGTQALLKSVSIQSVLAHSTPTLELEDVASEAPPHQPEPEIAPSQQKQPHQQQQQQRQNNYSHQRYRGRNRR
ncbi:flocculation protein FLO11 isoform X1 [Drosophila persimilis]|uniref:flocculation protein FLO11 isoform X1 n=1 Tax=Drosophila persimilis TaxID=7234 RepID=UPI000F076CA0|nr:flocculation protein FLO11 isoform X1 [Drosophila persimilis]